MASQAKIGMLYEFLVMAGLLANLWYCVDIKYCQSSFEEYLSGGFAYHLDQVHNRRQHSNRHLSPRCYQMRPSNWNQTQL